jgi:ethanolamine transporter EutH
MAHDVNANFVSFAVLLLLAGFICGPMFGGTVVFAIGVALYFMLTATNAISRGENRVRRKAQGGRKSP